MKPTRNGPGASPHPLVVGRRGFSPASRLWGLLFLHLGLSPVLFSLATVEAFDYPKSLLLQAVGLLAFSWMIAGRRPAPVPRLAGDPLSAGVLLFGVSAILSTVFSISPRTSLAGMPESFAGLPTLLAGTALFFAVRRACGSWRDARRLLFAPVIGASIAGSYALVQALGFDAFAWTRVAQFGGARPFGTLGNANSLGSFLAAMWPIEVCLAVHCQRRGRGPLAWALGASALIGALAIVRSASRAGWLGLGLGVAGVLCVLYATGERKVGRRLAFIGLGAAVAAGALALVVPAGRSFLEVLGARLTGGAGVASRRFLWSVAWDVFREHPLLGAGVDTFGLVFTPRRTPEFWAVEWNTTFVRAHNEALQLLATQGAVGGLAALLIIGGLWRAGRRAWRDVPPEERLSLGGVLVGLVCLLPQMAVGLLYTAPAALAVTLAGLLSVAARGEKGVAPPPSQAYVLHLSRGLAFLALLVALLNAGAWQGSAAAKLATLAAFCGPLLVTLSTRVRDTSARTVGRSPSRGDPIAPASPQAYGIASATGLILGLVFLQPVVSANAASARARVLEAEDPEAALLLHERAVSLDPGNPAYWQRLGESAQRAGRRSPPPSGQARRQRAREALARAADLEPLAGQYDMLLCRAIAEQVSAGEAPAAEAFAACERAIRKEPAHPYFRTVAVNAAVQLGDLRRARELVESGLALYPRLGALRYQLGFIDLQEGRVEAAKRNLTAAIESEWHGQESGREAAEKALAEARRRSP